MAENSFRKQSDELVKSLDKVFVQAPHLPENIREVLVKIAPWLALIFGVLGIIGGLGVIGVSPLATLGGVQSGFFLLASGVLTIISSVFMLLAYPKLTKGLYAGWMFLFWSALVSAVSGLLSLSIGSVISAVVGIIISFYLLFEIKGHYK